MSTSPRVRARPSIDAPSTGSTMPGNSVTPSIRIEALQVEQPLGRPDDHAARREVDLAHDLGNRWDQMLPRVVAHDPEVLRRRPLDAGYPPDLPPVLREHAAALELPGVEAPRSEEHTSELQSQSNLVCRLLLEKKKVPRSWAGSSAAKRGSSAALGSRTTRWLFDIRSEA